MIYLANNGIKKFVKEAIIDKLECDYKGFNIELDICGLASDLFYSEYTDGNGKYFEDNETAKQWIDENLENLRYIFENMVNDYGLEITNKILLNIFNNPNRLVLDVVMYISDYILKECKTVQELWNTEEITLTDELIDKITSEIEKV